jgi:NADH-ubiquinone oxidoreductase chain 3
MTFFFIVFIILTLLFLVLNFALAPHNPYQEKYSIFECGFHSFLGQNRTQFGIKFFIFGLVYLLLDLEIISIYPYAVSEYDNGVYGLAIVLIFTLVVTIGFVFELSKNALKIESRQTLTNLNKSNTYLDTFSEN